MVERTRLEHPETGRHLSAIQSFSGLAQQAVRFHRSLHGHQRILSTDLRRRMPARPRSCAYGFGSQLCFACYSQGHQTACSTQLSTVTALCCLRAVCYAQDSLCNLSKATSEKAEQQALAEGSASIESPASHLVLTGHTTPEKPSPSICVGRSHRLTGVASPCQLTDAPNVAQAAVGVLFACVVGTCLHGGRTVREYSVHVHTSEYVYIG